MTLGTSDHDTYQQDVTLSATNNRHCANISITEDTLPEENELFQLSMSNIRALFGFSPFQEHTPVATVTIFDDDGKCQVHY